MQAGNPPQTGSSQADSAVQAESASSQIASCQASSTISQGDNAVPPQTEHADAKAANTSPLAVSTNSQGVSTASPQAGSSQAIQAGSSQAEDVDAKAANTSPLAFSTNSQGVSAAAPQAGSSQAFQAGSSQAIYTALTPREIAPFHLKLVVPGQKVLMPRQPALLPKQSALTHRELALLPQAAQPSSQVNNANGSHNNNSLEDPNPKWVINLSSKPLTKAQRSVLGKGPNFEVTPRHPPNLDYIMAIVSVY